MVSGSPADGEEQMLPEDDFGSRIHRASTGLDVGVLRRRRNQDARLASLGRGSSLREAGALGKEHMKSSVWAGGAQAAPEGAQGRCTGGG